MADAPTHDPDQPIDDFRDLVREPCLLAEDLLEVSRREPDAWRRFASTAMHSMGKADWDLPFLVVRTHAEEVDGAELLFALVAMRPEDEDTGGALFGELACSPALYDALVKDFALERPVPREAADPLRGMPSPGEMDALAWSALLDDEDGAP